METLLGLVIMWAAFAIPLFIIMKKEVDSLTKETEILREAIKHAMMARTMHDDDDRRNALIETTIRYHESATLDYNGFLSMRCGPSPFFNPFYFGRLGRRKYDAYLAHRRRLLHYKLDAINGCLY